jgi:N-acetylglucosamine-6-phosphate deacetylase
MRLGVQAALVDGRLVPGDLELDGGVVAAVGVGSAAGGAIAAPGFVDLQVNGFAGVDLAGADAAGYRRAGEALLATGVTAYLPTFITAPEEELVAALRGLPATSGRPGGPRILGAHLEGPFLSPRRLGAHPPAGRRDPDAELLQRLLDAGPVRRMTLAPELPGALELIDTLVARGIVASLGHSDAGAAEAHRAFDRGARTVTHLFNAMTLGTPREPGLALAALARPDVAVELIVDGHHLAGDTVRVATQAARGRFALVTDAAAAAGMGEGDFVLGGRPIRSEGGAVRSEDGVLAGSALTMIDAVRNLHRLGVPLEDALSAATAVPARIAAVSGSGRIRPGDPADLVVLDDRLEIRQVLLAGDPVIAG